MKFILAVATSAALLSTVQATATINTPASLIECQPAALSWTGGTAPYYLSIIPGGEASAAALENLGEQTGTSLTWTVDIAAGTNVSLALTDSTGVVSYSSSVVILAGTTTTCVGENATAASSGTAAGTAAASTASASKSATTTATTASGSSTSKATSASATATSTGSSSSASASSTTSTTSGASAVNALSFGAMGGSLLVAFMAVV